MRELLFLSLANIYPRIKSLEPFKYLLYKAAGIKIKGKCRIFGPLTIRPIGRAKNIEIGRGCFLNTEIRFGCPKDKITIGDFCEIGPRVCFETVNHSLSLEENKLRITNTKEIIIEDYVWIGCGAIVLQGVTIGRGSVVAAGSVVNKNIPPNTVWGGVPARKLKDI